MLLVSVVDAGGGHVVLMLELVLLVMLLDVVLFVLVVDVGCGGGLLVLLVFCCWDGCCVGSPMLQCMVGVMLVVMLVC